MGNRRLELTWSNKDKRLLSHGASTYEWVEPNDWRVSEVRLLEHVRDVGEEPGRNLVIHGDALHALTSLTAIPDLAEQYLGKVKLCYIDPPFNTGETFAHYDDAVEHSIWLTMLRDRLKQIWKLLADDGSVWVHLDDVEGHRARAVLDEEFGAENFVGTVIWQKIHARNNSAAHFSSDHDFIHVYAKRASIWRPGRLPRTARSDADFWNPDDDPRGLWRRSDMTASKPYADGHYEVVGPHGDVFTPRPGRPWAVSKETFDELIADNRIWWGKTGRSFPFRKRFASELGDLVPHTVWLHEEVGNNREAKQEISALFGKDAFATPKPERLLARVIQLASNPGDIVLDCFAGSGTTAAVAHKLGRRYVTVELSESNLNTFVLPRLGKVVDGSDQGGISVPEAAKVSVEDMPEGMTPEQVKAALATLKVLHEHDALDGLLDDTMAKLEKRLKALTKTRKADAAGGWTGGGGFRVLRVAPSMFEADEDGDLTLAEWAVGGELAKAVCAQLRYTFAPDGPFVGAKGRSRLAVLDGMLTDGVAQLLLARLEDKQTLCVVAQAIEPGVEETLRRARLGSKARKMPRDLARAGILPSQKVVLTTTADGDMA